MMTRPVVIRLLVFACMLGDVSRPSAIAGEDAAGSRSKFAAINVDACDQAIEMMKNGSVEEQLAAAAQVQAAPHRFSPIVLCVMGELLFNRGQVDDGAFWFYAGALRARFDAMRCADMSARLGISGVERRYGGNIARYVAQDLRGFDALLKKVAAWDHKTPYAYDHRWVNLHGVQAVLERMNGRIVSNKEPMSVPREQWLDLAEQNRTAYVQNARGVVETISRDVFYVSQK